ncbi:Myc-type, basic helix-loop-helix domain-containing protein [Tanacetum coccineum]
MDTFFEDISANNVPTPPTQTTGSSNHPKQRVPNNEFEELLPRTKNQSHGGKGKQDWKLLKVSKGVLWTCTYPACIVNGVKFVVHERDILHTTQCSGVSTLGLDGEMYYGQLEEILELTYIGNRKVVLFRCKWFDTINPKNLTTRNRRSYIEHDITHILTDREFHKNNQYILATQVTQYFYLEDLADQPRVGRSCRTCLSSRRGRVLDQDVIMVETHQMLHFFNDDNANANEGNAEDDVYAHVLDVMMMMLPVVSDDDEVEPSITRWGCRWTVHGIGRQRLDVEYALSRLLQRGAVSEYQNEFGMLISRVKDYNFRRMLLLCQYHDAVLRHDAVLTDMLNKQPKLTGTSSRLLRKRFAIAQTRMDALPNKWENSIESEVVFGLPEEFQEGDMVDALSRVEQKVWKIGRTIGVYNLGDPRTQGFFLDDTLRAFEGVGSSKIKHKIDTAVTRIFFGENSVQGNVGQVLEQKNERDVLQRFAIAVVAMQMAEIYMFDEPSSYLDVKQRLKAAQVIRSLHINSADPFNLFLICSLSSDYF